MSKPLCRVSADTVARTLVLLLALVNQLLAVRGHSALPFTENEVYQTVSFVWTAVAAILAWWKNNSFTQLAREADAWMKQQKQG